MDKGISFSNLFKRVVSIGDKTIFSKDKWCNDIPLKWLFLKLYTVEENKYCQVMDMCGRRLIRRIKGVGVSLAS